MRSGEEGGVGEVEALRILNTLKPRLRPTKEELREALRVFENIKDVIDETLSRTLAGVKYTVELEGSFAKGTALRGDLDLDIFILLDKKDLSSRWLEENVIKPLAKSFSDVKGYRVVLKYASHPYLHLLTPPGIEADVVPAYMAPSPSDIVTPVDRTPFHTRYVRSRLSDDLKDEVRLLKKFFKGVGVYGAEIKSEGFSGYLCELLILKYGGFLNLLKNVIRWREPQVVAIDDAFPTSPSELKKVFRGAPLIVPDPVDPRRNAAAPVSRRSFANAMVASHEFLLSPSESFFEPRPALADVEVLENVLRLTGRVSSILMWRIRAPTSPDVMWGEAKSAGRSVANVLRSRGFTVTDVRFWGDEDLGIIAAYIEVFKTFEKYVLRRGPPKAGPELLRFMHKHLRESPVHAWISSDGTPYALVRVSKSFTDIILEYVRSHPPKHAESSVVCENLRSALATLKDWEKKPDTDPTVLDFLHWLTEAVLKRPPWLAIDGNSSGGST